MIAAVPLVAAAIVLVVQPEEEALCAADLPVAAALYGSWLAVTVVASIDDTIQERGWKKWKESRR
jgi:hypothetical protein